MALPRDLAAAVARAGVDPTAAPRALQDAPKATVTDRRGYVAWDVDHAGWRVDLLLPQRERFRGGTPEEALAWCLVWLLADEWGVGGSPDAGSRDHLAAGSRGPEFI